MKKLIEKYWHHAFIGGHAGYFSMVFIEGHGMYALIAGALAIMVAVGAMLHLGE